MKYFGREMNTEHPEGCMVLTWEDAEALAKENEKHCWGFSASDCLRLVADHYEAQMNSENGGDPLEAYRCMEGIEWRLEDANFHTLCGYLHNHAYDKALAEITETYFEK